MEGGSFLRVLVVEDSAPMRSLLGKLLAEEGCKLAGELHSGDALAATVAKLKPDIVFLDYHLPGRDGLDLLRELRNAFPKVAVVMITGDMDPTLYSRAVELGSSGFLTKPFTQGQFSDMLKQVTTALRMLRKPKTEVFGDSLLQAKAVVVDDSAAMRQLLTSILKSANIEVVAEGVNGKEAVKLVEKHYPDIVCLDVEMPVMNGIEALSEIHAMFPSMIALMVTSMNSREFVMQAATNGAQGYILKPYQPNVIISQVTRLLERKKSGDTKERRRHVRVTVNLPLKARFPGQPEANGKLVELSISGARMEVRHDCADGPKLNSEVEVCFSLPLGETAQELRLKAVIKHIYEVLAAEEGLPGCPYLVGVEYTGLTQGNQQVLEKFISGKS